MLRSPGGNDVNQLLGAREEGSNGLAATTPAGVDTRHREACFSRESARVGQPVKRFVAIVLGEETFPFGRGAVGFIGEDRAKISGIGSVGERFKVCFEIVEFEVGRRGVQLSGKNFHRFRIETAGESAEGFGCIGDLVFQAGAARS